MCYKEVKNTNLWNFAGQEFGSNVGKFETARRFDIIRRFVNN
jgi:hypothetical protein